MEHIEQAGVHSGDLWKCCHWWNNGAHLLAWRQSGHGLYNWLRDLMCVAS
ncbi:hypothetical protein CsatB_030635 [Cannabis sativa]